MDFYIDKVFIILLVDITHALHVNKTDKTAMQQTNSTKQDTNEHMMAHMETMATFGGAGLSFCCSVLLIFILCTLQNVRKRLKSLEHRCIKDKAEMSKQTPLTTQPSNQSSIPGDIKSIPIVTRRSEYIRHKNMTVAMEIRTRVSRLFSFASTSRSSADTFDLSNKQEDPDYDDILQFRKSRSPSENEAYHWCCCCCCKSTVNGVATETSNPEKTNEYSEPRTDETLLNENKTGRFLEPPTVKDDERNGILIKKKKQKTQVPDFQLHVQHVDFDTREKRIQPTTTDDVTIGVQPQQMKQINKENQLASFGKKTTFGQVPHQNREIEPQMPQKATTLTGFGKKKIPGIPLALPLPLKQKKSMPSVSGNISRNNKDTIPEEDDQEREPSYMDMAETLRN